MPSILTVTKNVDVFRRPPIDIEKLKKGHTANGKQWKVHIDGYNFLPRFKGETDKGPREQIFYFGQGGELNAVRWNDWKVHFAQLDGAINDAIRNETAWPAIVHLKADPYEHAWEESEMYVRWMVDNMWLFVPIQVEIQKFIASLDGYPFQEEMVLIAGDINCRSLKALKILEQIRKKGLMQIPTNSGKGLCNQYAGGTPGVRRP